MTVLGGKRESPQGTRENVGTDRLEDWGSGHDTFPKTMICDVFVLHAVRPRHVQDWRKLSCQLGMPINPLATKGRGLDKSRDGYGSTAAFQSTRGGLITNTACNIEADLQETRQ